LYYTDKVQETWIGASKVMLALDRDQNGEATELVILDNLGDLFYSDGRKQWTKIPTPEPMNNIIAVSLDGNNAKEGLVAISKSNKLYKSSDLNTWTQLPITPLNIAAGDADGDGESDDLFVVASNKSIWKTTDYQNFT